MYVVSEYVSRCTTFTTPQDLCSRLWVHMDSGVHMVISDTLHIVPCAIQKAPEEVVTSGYEEATYDRLHESMSQASGEIYLGGSN